MRPSLRHLWSGDWRSESDAAREAAAEERAERARQARAAAEAAAARAAAERPMKRDRGTRRIAAAALVLAALSAGAFGVTTLRDEDGGTDPLPAVSESPLKPRHGQTLAGAVYAKASPAVVSVRTNGGSGTGFLIDGDGRIVTNAHVVGESDRVLVRFGPDGDTLDGEVLGTDPSSDLAVVDIAPQFVPDGVKPLKLADSRGVQVGDLAIAIGNPFGLDRTATEGIVSALGREIQAPNGFSIDSVIQTDAPINPGNSGGPLLDESGRVIGVNSQIAAAGSPGNVGIGFAVPSNTVREVVPVLQRGDTIERPYLGVSTAPASPSNPAGAQVESVVSGGPADRAGVRAGDVITSVDGNSVQEPSDVGGAISDDKPGDRVEIEVQRDGDTVRLEATLGTRPGRTP